MKVKKEKTAEEQIFLRRQKCVNELFEDAVIHLKQQTDNRRAAKIYDMIGPVLKRRKEAALSMMDQVCTRYQKQCPDLDLERAWAAHCCCFGHSIDGIDSIYHISLAAALWILDALKSSYQLRAAMPLLQLKTVDLSLIELPDFHDPLYDQQMIRSMIYLIQNRDIRDNRFQWYISPSSAKRKEPEVYEKLTPDADVDALTPRQRLNAILAMLHPKLRERAVTRFEEKYWEFLDLIFAGAQEHEARANRWASKAEKQLEYCKTLGEAQRTAGPVIPGSSSPLFPASATADAALQYNIQEGMEYDSRSREERDTASNFLTLSHMIPMEDRRWIDGFPDEDVDRLLAFGVDDPYETCFAYLCLLDAGSDLPWTYTPAAAVLLAAVRKLPWTVFTGDSEFDEDLWEELPEPEDRSEPEPSSGEEDTGTDEEDQGPIDWIKANSELYRLRYQDNSFYFPKKSPAEDWKINLPQVVYGNTRVLMPRILHSYMDFSKDLIQDGMEPHTARTMELYFQLADDANCAALYRFQNSEPDDNQEIPGPSTPQPEVDSDTEDKLVLLKQELQDAKARLSVMAQALHTAENAAAAAKEELAGQLAAAEEERQELAALRELVYHQSNERPSECAEASEAIPLPFHTHRKIAVFGGHETWLKAIRPLLPDVVFISRGQSPNTDLIRGQDVIWIQANAMGHSDFFKLINTTRANHIPVRYFGFASAKKCAEQLACDELQYGD